ncbi:NADPH oxidase 5 isoform X2 [Strongylocentrotus purpuratus]|uniref:NADPH oxidase 5 n=1 Tax=Strongylocentrotus purpuratus TaxID=7668 RepID=A0A7M7PJE4_STRPU|nr:NADPH oxidase 5 isoform X2 [Strongylocentrotus purpuratus]
MTRRGSIYELEHLISRKWSVLRRRLSRQERDEKWLAKLEKRFNAIAGDDNQIDLEEFKSALNVKKSFFAERFFELIDTDQSGSISLKELIGALRLLVNGTEQEKLHFLFQVYDADGSGFIDFDELKTVLHSCTAESALTLSDETLTELTEILFDDADVDGDGEVSFEELSEQLQRYPGITANLSISAAEWLNPQTSDDDPTKKHQPESATSTCCSYHTLRNHFSVITFAAVFVMINAGLAAWGAYEGYQSIDDERHPVALCIARSTGRCLSFNCCFVLVLMLRKLLTQLRNTFLMSVLPLDQHVTIHKVVGVLILILTIIHVAGHLTNIGLIYHAEMLNETTLTEIITRPVPGVGLVESACNITGLVLVVVLVVMILCSLPFIRRNGYFKVFYWTHQLCIIFWCLLVIHSKYFWMWFIVPGMIYIAERFLRLRMYRRARFGIIHIQEGYVLPANVVHLVIQRPANFKFHAGEYIYVNIPSIASHEWHPFTISSAPEQLEFLSLHIRCLGHWTKRLYDVFKERELAQLRESEPDPCDIDNDVITTCLNHRNMDKPLDVVAEVCSTKTTPSGSPSRQRDTPLDSPLRKTGQGSPQKASGRKRNISGEMNSGFEPESPIDAEATKTTLVDGTPCNSHRKDDVLSEQMSESLQRVKLPGIVNTSDSTSKTDEPPVRDGGSPSHVTAVDERTTESRFVKGKGFQLKHLNSLESIDIQDAMRSSIPASNGHGTALDTTASDPPQGDTTEVPPVMIKRTDSSLSRRLFTKKLNDNVGRKSGPPLSKKNSRKKLRRNHTLHSLDVARSLGGAPHTGMEVILDGPYGAPAQHIMEAEHAVLIGAGIGITPFASILQSIHERYKAAKKHCPNCHHAWVADAATILKTKKVDFFWINRQQLSFEWFISLLNAIEMEQAEIPVAGRFLDIHLYMTSALSPSDMKAIGLHVALDLIHKKNKRDTITGLMTRTQPGRPNWEEVFQNLKRQEKGRITVFFCGSPALGKIIRTKCLKYQMDFRKENF